ncbi:MAG: hypothetical protein JWP15_1822, partial [Alphaproteobacteria bacterium]|nr:hypothetical protein [Alphaproteobacteria bacterium]
MVQLYSRVGDEFVVNTRTEGQHDFPALEALPGGGFVAVWMDNSGLDGDADGWAIKGQIFGPDGLKVGAEFLVNSATSGDQIDPDVTTFPSGRFLVTWTDASGVGADVDDVKAQLFAADGSRIGGEFRVNTSTQGPEYDPVATELPNGGFVIA